MLELALNCFIPEQMTFSKDTSLVLLVFKPVSEVVVHQLAGVQGEVSIFNNQIRNTFVEVRDLGDFSALEKFLKVVDLFADSVVVISEFMWSYLKLFCTLYDSKMLNGELAYY